MTSRFDTNEVIDSIATEPGNKEIRAIIALMKIGMRKIRKGEWTRQEYFEACQKLYIAIDYQHDEIDAAIQGCIDTGDPMHVHRIGDPADVASMKSQIIAQIRGEQSDNPF